MYVLLEVNTDARKVVKTKHIGYTKKVETDRVVSEDTIIDHGIPTKTKTVTYAGEPGHISNGMDELLAKLQANAQKND